MRITWENLVQKAETFNQLLMHIPKNMIETIKYSPKFLFSFT